MEPFSAIGRSLSTRRVSARRQEAEDSREENGIPTPAIAANATNFHHPGAGSVQITKKASPWASLLCFVFPLLEAVPRSDPLAACTPHLLLDELLVSQVLPFSDPLD